MNGYAPNVSENPGAYPCPCVVGKTMPLNHIILVSGGDHGYGLLLVLRYVYVCDWDILQKSLSYSNALTSNYCCHSL